MTVQERERQLRIVAEILVVHLPPILDADQELAHDLLAVAGKALRTVHEDAEKSAKAWDKRAYHVRADKLRREWGWVLGAANYALGLALRSAPLTATSLKKLKVLIRPDMKRPARRQIKEPERFRGAAKAIRLQEARKRKPIRG